MMCCIALQGVDRKLLLTQNLLGLPRCLCVTSQSQGHCVVQTPGQAWDPLKLLYERTTPDSIVSSLHFFLHKAITQAYARVD